MYVYVTASKPFNFEPKQTFLDKVGFHKDDVSYEADGHGFKPHIPVSSSKDVNQVHYITVPFSSTWGSIL